MQASRPTAYERLLPWKRTVEVGFWVVYIAWNATFNSITVVMDVHKAGLAFADWEPVVWEWSSNLGWLLLVWPLVRFTAWRPLRWTGGLRKVAEYLLASVVFSLLHVVGMYALRALVYRWMGGEYRFGGWLSAWPYEYLKDVRSFFVLVVFIETWRLLIRRLQGEAQLLDAPDDGPPAESVERPERFLVRKLGREFLIAVSEIEWAQASGNYVNLRVRGHDYPLRSTMAALEARLDPQCFVRIHRSYLVNLRQVASIEPLESGDARVHLREGVPLPCSRSYRAALREAA